MPELPEVETIRRQLVAQIVGAIVVSVEVRRESCYRGPIGFDPELIMEVERFGKYLFVHFESGRGLVIHLKMTGRLIVNRTEYEALPHTRVVLRLADGRRVYYWDARTFGYIHYVEDSVQERERQRAKLGPDPWQLGEQELYSICQKYSRPIKNLILDQALLAGVGNIYANDGLWEAGIDPRRRADKLSKTEVKKILLGLRKVMERGLVTGGASDNSYVNALGERGSYQEEFRVYRRTNEPCLLCDTKLKRIVVGGRGTWVCEKCQK